MRIAVNNHQHKADRLIEALMIAGHTITANPPADVLLIDFDGMVSFYPQMIEEYVLFGAKVLIYSHGATPIVVYDGIWEPSDRVSAYLAMTPGQKEVMQTYGYPYPIHVIGWHYCDILPFQSCPEPRKVLFAPWHPHGNGYLHPERKRINRDIYDQLRRRHYGYDVTVRTINHPHLSGLDKIYRGVTYIKGRPDNSTADIDAADVVIAEGTFAYLAVARGKPVVMLGQGMRPMDGYTDEGIKYVWHWKKYKDIMRYPYDVGDGALSKLIHQAANNEATAWKEKFIGKPMDKQEFVRLVEAYGKP